MSSAMDLFAAEGSPSPPQRHPLSESPLPKSMIGSRRRGGASSSASLQRSGAPSAKYNVTGCTPGARSAHTAGSSAPRSFVIAAVVEGRGVAKGEIGLVSIDLRHSEISLAQFSDTSGYSRLRVKLQIALPIEIVVPDTAVERDGTMAVMVQLMQNDMPKTQITTVHRRHFNDARGLELINRLKVAECSTIHKDMDEKYYCLACVSALIKYVEFIQNIAFAPASVKFSYKGVENTCMIDSRTAKHLELIVNLRDKTRTDASLYGAMNGTLTACGGRLLRASLLQPPADAVAIARRQDAVDDLLASEETFGVVRSLVARMVDIDQLVTLCVHLDRNETIKTAEYKVTQVIYLKHTLELVEPLREALAQMTCDTFKAYHDVCPAFSGRHDFFGRLKQILCDKRYADIIERIGAVVDEDTRIEKGPLNMRTQKCFAVRSGVCGMLDVARRTYTELYGDVDALVSEELHGCTLPLHIVYTVGRGFHLQLRSRDTAGRRERRLPDACINVVHRRHLVSCTTRTLVRLNDRINQAVNEIFLLSNKVMTELLADLREFIGCLYNLTEAIATLDMLTSIAHFSTQLSPSVRPEFTSSLAVKAGQHPLLQRFADEQVTPNDVYAGAESSFVIVTGPNMVCPSAPHCCTRPIVQAGKSTYLKQVALLQILAQIGSYVPAEYASMRLCEQIFSRIGHNDDFENDSSAFMVEMKDMAYILQNVTPQSLVLIDELGRSTATEEGIGICHAIAEQLIPTGALVFFATHFLDLTNLDSLYANVQNYHFEPQVAVDADREQLRLVHKLRKGPYRGPLYGLELAQVAALPEPVLRRARSLAAELQKQRQGRASRDPQLRRQIATMRLGHQLLLAAKYVDMDEAQLILYLKQLKQRFESDVNQD